MSKRDFVMRIEELSAVRAAWEELFDHSPNATPFASHAWFVALAENLLKIKARVLLFQHKNAVVGLIPGMVIDDTLRLLGDERVTDLNDMIFNPGYEDGIMDLLADYLIENDLRVDLYPLEENSPLVAGLIGRLPELTVEKKDPCPLLHLTGTWEGYLTELGSKRRHELRRKMRKVNGAMLKDVQPRDVDMLFKFMAWSDEKKAEFLSDETRGFIMNIAHAFSRNGWLRMRAAIAGENVLGMLLAFGFRGRVYLFNMGFDPQLRDLSPGIVTLGLDIKDAISGGYKHYDFLRGDEDYKYRLGAVGRNTVRVAG